MAYLVGRVHKAISDRQALELEQGKRLQALKLQFALSELTTAGPPNTWTLSLKHLQALKLQSALVQLITAGAPSANSCTLKPYRPSSCRVRRVVAHLAMAAYLVGRVHKAVSDRQALKLEQGGLGAGDCSGWDGAGMLQRGHWRPGCILDLQDVVPCHPRTGFSSLCF